jgi:hypothetical protein
MTSVPEERDESDDEEVLHDLEHNVGDEAEKGLVGALRSLERSINAHCKLLNRRKSHTDKGSPLDALGVGTSVNAPVLPRTALRSDKVLLTSYLNYLLHIHQNESVHCLICHGRLCLSVC